MRERYAGLPAEVMLIISQAETVKGLGTQIPKPCVQLPGLEVRSKDSHRAQDSKSKVSILPRRSIVEFAVAAISKAEHRVRQVGQ